MHVTIPQMISIGACQTPEFNNAVEKSHVVIKKEKDGSEKKEVVQ